MNYDNICFDGHGGVLFPVAKITIKGKEKYVYSESRLEQLEAIYNERGMEYTVEHLLVPEIDFSGREFYRKSDVESFIKINNLEVENRELGQTATEQDLQLAELGQAFIGLEISLLEGVYR